MTQYSKLEPISTTSDPVKLRSKTACLRQRIEDLTMFNKVPPKYLAQILNEMLGVVLSTQDVVEDVKELSSSINEQTYRIERRMSMVDEPEFEQSEEYDPEYSDDDPTDDGKLDTSDDVVDKS